MFIRFRLGQTSDILRPILIGLALLILGVGVLVQQSSSVGAASHSISISPASGSPGQSVTVTGTGFANPETVTLTFGSTVINVSVSGSTGWSQAVTVPSAPGGLLTVTANGSVSGIETGDFTVLATASLDPITGSPGTIIDVEGEGFAASQPVIITFNGDTVNTQNTLSAGSLNTSFAVPAIGAGTYLINIGSFPSISFAVTSGLAISPSSGPPGTSVQITGTGFTPSTAIDLSIAGVTWQSITADGSGGLNRTLQIPQVAGGSQSITVSGGSVTANFDVTPTLAVDLTTVAPGDTVNVSGTAFRANETGITVKFDSTNVATSVNADAQGSWSASVTIPSSTAGSHNITASGPSTTTNIPTAKVTIGAGVSLGTTSGPPGTQVKVKGTGARSNESLTIDVGGGLATFKVSADSKGVWETEITVPAAPKGALSIHASGSSGNGATASFNITPTMRISEPTGFPGSAITVEGEGFGANQPGITISFDNDIITSASSNSRGSWSVELTIPPSNKATYFIKATGSGAEQQTPFTVTPGLFVDKPQAGPGERATVSGVGFAPNETGIMLKLGDTTIKSGIVANAQGSWDTTFVIPPLFGSSYQLTASGTQTSAGSVQELIFTLTTRLTLSASSGSPGTTIVLTGQGFAADEQGLSILYDNTAVVSGISTDGFGAFTRSFEIPPSTAGRHLIVVAGSDTGAASGSEISFQVQPRLVLENDNGPSGSTIQIVGSGFGPNEPNIEIKFGSDTVISGVSADSNGSLEQSFLIPPNPAGQHKIITSSSTGSLSAHAQGTYTVVSNIDLSETTGNVGMELSVAGTGFNPDSSVTLTYDDVAVATAISDILGRFSLQFVVPESPKGDHVLQVLDERGNLVQDTFEVEGIPPLAPVLRSPSDGGRGGIFGGFEPLTRWAAVEDPSGVTYNVQLATDPEFSDIVLDKKGLSSPTYKLTGEEALASGKYYWRVQAVDGASNAGPYSVAYEMNSGIIPIWLFLAMVAVGLIALGGGAYAYYTRVYLPKKVTQQAPVFPDFVRISRPEIAAPAPAQQPTVASSSPALPAPRRDLSNPFRRGGGGSSGGRSGVSPEQQARLRLVLDFVNSIPLMEVSPDLLWVEELVDSLGGGADDRFNQVLRGDLEPVYQPAWMQHPTYQEMQSEAAAAAFLEGLEVYIESVNDCAADILAILRRIYGDLESGGSLDALGSYKWRYVLSVAQSTIAWFLGTYLGQPSSREYIIKSGTGVGGEGLTSLMGVDRSPFSGSIIEDLHEEDLVFYRDLHIQLRNNYRNDDEARDVAAKMTATSTMRDQLNHNIAHMGEQSQGR